MGLQWAFNGRRSFEDDLQPLPMYRLLASRHILYGRSECSHILYAKPLAIRTGKGVVDKTGIVDKTGVEGTLTSRQPFRW